MGRMSDPGQPARGLDRGQHEPAVPADTLQLCMSSHRFGITNDTSGSLPGWVAGNFEYGLFSDFGRSSE